MELGGQCVCVWRVCLPCIMSPRPRAHLMEVDVQLQASSHMWPLAPEVCVEMCFDVNAHPVPRTQEVKRMEEIPLLILCIDY